MNVFERLKEPSTMRGLVALAAILGANISPEHIQAILTTAGLIYSAIQILRKENK